MQNSTSTIIAIIIVGVLLFIVPLVALADRSDNVAQENVKLIVEEYVAEIKNTGKITRAKFQEFEAKLDLAGNNSYDIEIQVQHLDENPGKKTSQVNYTKIGENVYYTEYTTQVLNQIGIKTGNETVSSNDTMILKQGDIVTVYVKNSNSTSAQSMKSSFLGFSNAGEYKISASASGMVSVNGIKD